MSKFLKEPVYSRKALNNQWLNCIIATHDLFCGCEEAINHLKSILPKEKCRHSDAATSTETGGTTKEEDLIFRRRRPRTTFSRQKKKKKNGKKKKIL